MSDIPVATPEAVKLMMEGGIAFAKMEANGMRVDVPYLDNAIKETGEKARRLEEELKKDEVWNLWRKHYGLKASLGSTTQLANIIFDKLGYTPASFTDKTQKAKTDEEAFVNVKLPFIKSYFQVKKLKNAKTTFLEGIRREVVDDIVRPSWNIHLAETFRSSCSVPNVQNQPNRLKDIAEIIRRSFIPREGNVLAEIDFGAQEFRLAACWWADPGMVAYASDPKKDIHRDKAMELFQIPKEEVTKELRHLAKNQFVFPILYGSYYKQCARKIWAIFERSRFKLNSGLSLRKHFKQQEIRGLGEDSQTGSFEFVIKQAEDKFNREFPMFGEGKEKWWSDYQKRGWFRTLAGFIIQGVYSRNFLMNSPIQSTGFHCLLWCLIQLQNWLEKYRMRTKIIAEIHDCMLLDGPRSEMQDVLSVAKWIMTEGLQKHWKWLIVPMAVEVDCVDESESWHSKRPWIEDNGIWKEKE